MRLRGINYDVGIDYGGGYVSRPVFDRDLAARELGVIKRDLHCNAVRLAGTDPERLIAAAQEAVALGLDVWVSPHLHDCSSEETVDYVRSCASMAEELRAGVEPAENGRGLGRGGLGREGSDHGGSDHGGSGRRGLGRVVLVLGTELTIFMAGVLPGETLAERLAHPELLWSPELRDPRDGPLARHLAAANLAVREVFHGPVTYASAQFEAVDWSRFDAACLDHYRSAGNRAGYGDEVRTLRAWGRPTYLTELGCCAYRGAEQAGGMGWAIVDGERPGRLKTAVVRDEELQAREVIDMLTVAEGAGADGAFVFTFSTPALPGNEDPLLDLDLAGYGIVRTLPEGAAAAAGAPAGTDAERPDLPWPWTPKVLFGALAEHYGDRVAAP